MSGVNSYRWNVHELTPSSRATARQGGRIPPRTLRHFQFPSALVNARPGQLPDGRESQAKGGKRR